jgi:hypothetical protein
VNVAEPPFEYQTTLSSFSEAEKMSQFPSPFMSRACARQTPSAVVETTRSENDCEPSFSCQATLSSLNDAATTSWSPSPSTSMAMTLAA